MVMSTRIEVNLAHRVYQEILTRSAGQAVPDGIARELDITCEQVQEALSWLADHGLVDPDTPSRAATPQTAFRRLLAVQLERMKELERGNGILADIGEFLAEPVSEHDELTVEVLKDAARLRGRLTDLQAANRSEALVMLPSLVEPEGLDASLRDDLQALERGIRYCLLVHVSVLRQSASLRYLTALQDAGAQVRIAESLPLRLLVLDREKVIVRAQDDKKHRDLVIDDDAIAQLFVEIFEHIWSTAVPYTSRSRQRGAMLAELTSTHTRVLRMMAAGATDKAIGRYLGYSDRTVRRLVSEVLGILETDNRFTAIAKATRLGLVDLDEQGEPDARLADGGAPS